MFLLIDNYDSFSYNLVHYIEELGINVEVRRNDTITTEEALALSPEAIVISPGPGIPTQAGICLNLVQAAAKINIPILGVCLGHQVIGEVFGCKIIKAPEPVHGKVDKIMHGGLGLFHELPNNFIATRYHSLIVDSESFPDELEVSAKNSEGIIMGIKHKHLPVYGVQFHPESIATAAGQNLLANFVELVTGKKSNITLKPGSEKWQLNE
jgi:anthranilate synthase component 2